MEKVLVTGGAGFIGSWIVHRLIQSGCFVYVLDNFRTGREENVRAFQVGRHELIRDSIENITAHASLREVHKIFHLAAEVGNVNSIDRPVCDASTNILGTIKVCQFAREIGAKVVYSSSSAIYGQASYLPMDEQHPLQPISPYGLSKLTGELYVRLYGQLHNMSFVCLRYFNVYGEGQFYNPYANVIPIFVQRLCSQQPLTIYGDGKQTRDFVHVSDVARANIVAGDSPEANGIYNVATGVRSSLRDLVCILRELEPGAEVVFQAPRAGEVQDSVADIASMRVQLGFEATVDLREGVRRYYDWRRSREKAVDD